MMRHDIFVLSPKTLPKNKTVLIISPHPDDTSIAVGGAAILLSKHNRVVSVIMTTGHRAEIKGLTKAQRIRAREDEVRKESRALGIDCTFMRLDLYDSGKIQKQDVDQMSALLETYRPDIIMMPNMQDPHPTHHLSSKLALQMLKQYLKLHQVTVDVWYYESPWSLFNRDDYNAMIPIANAVFKQKLKAIKAHKSQTERTRYDVIATSLAQLRAEIIPEQQLAGYGDTPPDLGHFVELFSVETLGQESKLVESLSGIRGIYRKGLTLDVAEAYAFAYGRWLTQVSGVNPKVVVAVDTRTSGPMIREAVLHGLNRAHCHAVDLGIATTPMLQFEVRKRKSDGGVMITASHNEPMWNGFKFLGSTGGAVTPEQMAEIIAQYHQVSDTHERPHVDHYIEYLLNGIGKPAVDSIHKAKFSAVLDPNGGAMVVLIESLFKELGIKTIKLNMQAGKFSHTIEPTAAALQHLGPLVRKHNADLGVAWDCDGDRVEVVSSSGELLSGHRVLALLVDQVLRHQKKGQTVVVNAMTSGVVAEIARRHEAHVIETDVGEANVVAAMEKSGAAVGGEGGSGGGIVPPSRCRDGVVTLLKILEMMAEQKKSLTTILKEYPSYYTSSSNLKIPKTMTVAIRQQLIDRYRDAEHVQLGGPNGSLKLRWPDGTFLWCRESKTEPDLLRVVVDSPHKKRTETLFLDALKWLQQSIHTAVS